MTTKKRINVSMSPVLHKAVQEYCRRNGREFSDLVSDLLRRHLESLGYDTEEKGDLPVMHADKRKAG
jgi:metal-responsive CopG/Arc/MetJ family transcriptional regulator